MINSVFDVWTNSKKKEEEEEKEEKKKKKKKKEKKTNQKIFFACLFNRLCEALNFKCSLYLCDILARNRKLFIASVRFTSSSKYF